MAKKSELVKEGIELAAGLGLDVEISEDMTHDALTEIVKDLRAKKVDEETPTVADDAEEDTVVETIEVPEGAPECFGLYVFKGAKKCRVCREHKACKVVSKK